MFQSRTHALSLALLAASASRAAAACDGVISTFAGECNLVNFVANLDAGCTLDELFPADADGTAQDHAAAVAEVCAYDAPTAFVEIQGTYQRDRRYFSGGGPLVDGGSWERDAARLRRFEAHLGGGTLIGFPEYAARVQYNGEQGLGNNGYPANMNLETGCELNTVMCCFTDDGRGQGFAGEGDATTDVCRHDLSLSPQSSHIKQGWSIFPGSETSTHCTGFTWKEGEDELLGNMMYDVSLRNSANKGYVKGVPGAPMCGCIEHMPVVETAACRTASKTDAEITYTFAYQPAADDDEGYVYASNAVGIAYADCAESDLKAQFVADNADDAERAGLMDYHLVGAGNCDSDVDDYMNEEHFLIQQPADDKYLVPDPDVWSDAVVGEGIYFQPPAYTRTESDGHFRDLLGAGCTEDDADGNPAVRSCIVRRICAGCYASHRDIYYKRLTPLPAQEGRWFLDLFMNNWVSEENVLNTDFELYSTYEDALAGTNGWTYCNYNDSGIGFPRDCGPTGGVGSQWNSYTRGGGHADNHAFYVEKPATK